MATQKTTKTEPLISMPEAARYLGVERSVAYRWAKQGLFKTWQVGGLKTRMSVLDAFIHTRERKAK